MPGLERNGKLPWYPKSINIINRKIHKMRKQLLLFILILFPALLLAQSGKVFDNLSMKSEILKMDRKYAIYLPPDL